MLCITRARLEQRYLEAVAIYGSARQRLLERVATCSKADFLVLTDQVDLAGDLLREAHGVLDEHIRQHSCVAEDGAAAAGESST